MVARDKDRLKGMSGEAKKMAKTAQENPWVDKVARIGYATRGIIYGLVGYLAIQAIFTGRGQITGRAGVLSTIASKPYGKIILIVIVIGLIGLFLWNMIRAFADPYDKGNDVKGLIARVGYFISGVSYLALEYPTIQLLANASKNVNGGGQTAQRVASGILSTSWGPWVVGLIGAGIAIAGLVNIYRGWKGNLEERLKGYQMSATERKWTLRMGRIGRAALGVVLAIIGSLAILAATTSNASKIAGIDGALTFLAQQPFGPWLLGIVALGLIAFAIYSFMGALWFRIRTA